MHRIHLPFQNLLNSKRSVKPRRHRSTSLLDRGDRLSARARHDDLDRRRELVLPAREQLDAISDIMNAAGREELFHRDRLRSIEPAGVYPILDPVEVDGAEVDGEAGRRTMLAMRFGAIGRAQILRVLKAPFARNHFIGSLSAVEARGDFAVLLLAFVAAPGGLALAAGGSAAAANALVVGSFCVGEGGEDGGGAGWMEAWV